MSVGKTVYFHGAGWCPQCHQVQPTVEKLCKQRSVKFVYVDIDSEAPKIPNLTSIPAILIDTPNEEPVVLRSSAVNVRTLAVAI